jgi:hypothetical protein
VNSVRLDPVSSDATGLSLADPHVEEASGAPREYWMECRASLDDGGQSTAVALSMIQPYREDTVELFEKLASMPDDWLGEQTVTRRAANSALT